MFNNIGSYKLNKWETNTLEKFIISVENISTYLHYLTRDGGF